MRINKLRCSLSVSLLLLGVMGCKREMLNKPIDGDTNQPGIVSNVVVVNQNGKATLSYSLPVDENLLYVKAVYETMPGRSIEVKASYYTNSLVVEGFGDTLEHEVKLYAVSSSEVMSAPVSVKVKPLTPPIDLAFRTLKVVPTFGGINISCENVTTSDLTIVPLVDTLNSGNWFNLDNVYSHDSLINRNIRGMDTVQKKFAFYIRDRWLNHSDTLFMEISPFFEKLFSKSDWKSYPLPGDAVLAYGTLVPKMYDGNQHPGWPNVAFTDESAGSPQTLTLDLGVPGTYSRLLINSYKELGNKYYVRGAPKDFEIWGSNSPNLNGAYDASWTRLLTCNVTKPSGLPAGEESGVDAAVAYDGWAFEFPAGLPAYRYIRIKNLRNWQGTYFMTIAELTLWGK